MLVVVDQLKRNENLTSHCLNIIYYSLLFWQSYPLLYTEYWHIFCNQLIRSEGILTNYTLSLINKCTLLKRVKITSKRENTSNNEKNC